VVLDNAGMQLYWAMLAWGDDGVLMVRGEAGVKRR